MIVARRLNTQHGPDGGADDAWRFSSSPGAGGRWRRRHATFVR
jgi:hypothetical protein